MIGMICTPGTGIGKKLHSRLDIAQQVGITSTITSDGIMGTTASTKMTTEVSGEPRKPKVLCLHGFRTSGRILSMQMAAMKFNTDIDCSFMDGPYPCRGSPDAGIAMVYPNEPYFEWYNDIETVHEIEIGIKSIIEYLTAYGPYDGILGFSQGAAMATRIAHLQSNKDKRLSKVSPLKFFVLIGGVNPSEYAVTANISIPSLHIIGTADPMMYLSQQLTRLYDAQQRHILQHSEGHNIPSMRTNLYPPIKEWIYSKYL